MSVTVNEPLRRADQYDDPSHNYLHYWDGRDYEHAAELLALGRLLDHRHFGFAVDVGGGFGRLSKVLTGYADKVLLAEPSRQQLDIAEEYLAGCPTVERRQLQAADLQLDSTSVDLVLCVRVLHHLPAPGPEFAEIARVLKPGGTFVLEFANSANALRRLRLAAKGKRVPREPINLRSTEIRSESDIPFVNHHPATVLAQLSQVGLEAEELLSGSNLRSARLKAMLPSKVLLGAERMLQPAFAPLRFGPSMWVRARRA